MKKIRCFLKRNIKLLIALVVGFITPIIVVNGAKPEANMSRFGSNEIQFNNTHANLTLNSQSVTNVQDAIDALNEKADSASGCPSGYTKGTNALIGYSCGKTSTTVDEMVAKASQIAGLESIGDTNYTYAYVGMDPANYIQFNDELWRIIGIYNFSSTNYLKIVKATPLGTKKAYHSSTSTNAWSGSALQTYLNGPDTGNYYDTLLSTAQNMIYGGTNMWYAGANAYSAKAAAALTNAKGTIVSQKVGLVACYEYLYAAGSGCQNIVGIGYNSGTPSCASKDWLYNTLTTPATGSRSYGWMMTPYSSSTSNALIVDNTNGNVNYNTVTDTNYVSPAVFLKSTITITGGNGTADSPYTLACTTC